MNSKTQELTYGAMLLAVFGMLLLLNRQTGNLLEELIFFVLPIPMAIFSLKYGWRDSLPVLFCMSVFAFFLGTLYTVYYATVNAVLGLVLGAGLRSRRNLNLIQLLIILLSAFFSVVGTIALASVIGIDLQTEIAQMQQGMNSLFASSGMDPAVYSSLLSGDYLRRMYVISMILLGVVQGFIVFRLSLLILKRLRLPVPEPSPIGLYYPPRWTGYAAALLLFLYLYSFNKPLGNEPVTGLLQTLGLCGYIYLLCFGWIALTLVIRRHIPGKLSRLIAGVIAMILVFISPLAFLVLGFAYVSTRFHDLLLGIV